MNRIYLTQGVTVHPHRREIERGGEVIKVRAKTFALLLLLLDNPKEILAKQVLLASVWDDVNVDEQVLFQSIREIRQLFDNAEVIKTYSRKGYAWVADVQCRPSVEAQGVSVPVGWRVPAYGLSAILLFGLIWGLLWGFGVLGFGKSAETQPLAGPVIVLPVRNQVPGTDHDWVYLGAMDQLIGLLKSDKTAVVMGTDYVLETMRHAQLSRDYSSEQVADIFSVSGVALVVESQLYGWPEDYRLRYKLHFRDGVKRGVILERTLNAALNKLGQEVASYTGQTLDVSGASGVAGRTEFRNELMAQAFEYGYDREFQLARGLLASIVQLEPDNLVARRLLTEVLTRLEEFEQAQAEAQSAIALAKASANEELGRLQYWLAVTQFRQGLPEVALATLREADAVVSREYDWLYRAYIAQGQGDVHAQQGNYERAQVAYEQAMGFYDNIRCPAGASYIHLKMVDLFQSQGEASIAAGHYSSAKSLIETHKLDTLVPLLERRTKL